MNKMDKPILFSTDMVKAILLGRKTQTRRPVLDSNGRPPRGEWMGEIRQGGRWITARNQSPNVSWAGFYTPNQVFYIDGERHIDGLYYKAPAQPGATLWVRETWYYENHMHDLTEGEPDLPSGRYSHRYIYRASCPEYPVNVGVGEQGWKPSIHMPREASRIDLLVKSVRVERVQDITEEDARVEGITSYWADPHKNIPPFIGAAKEPEADLCHTRREAFKQLWDSIYSKRGFGWGANPWVWVIEFQVVKP